MKKILGLAFGIALGNVLSGIASFYLNRFLARRQDARLREAIRQFHMGFGDPGPIEVEDSGGQYL